MEKQGKFFLSFILVLIAGGLLYWALKDIPFSEISLTLSRLSFFQIAILIMVNTLIMILFGLRWWLILKEMGHDIPLINIARYRLAAFGVSYFTPGPQFGGEPLQVIFLNKNHRVETSEAIASVSFDKLIELISNFSFLLIALAVVVQFQLFPNLDIAFAQAAAIFLLSLPLIYFGNLYFGITPISIIAKKIRISWYENIEDSENYLLDLVRNKPRLLLVSLTASLIVWLALIYEYQLALSFLGIEKPFVYVLAIMLLARLAMLTPTPGALGALEASLVISFTSLNLAPAAGISLGLLIRSRDILFGGLGLAIGLGLKNSK